MVIGTTRKPSGCAPSPAAFTPIGSKIMLWPMHPDTVSVRLAPDKRSLLYEVTEPGSVKTETLLPREVLRGLF